MERAAAILRILAAEAQPTPLSHLAGALGLAKGTTHGLVQTLKDVGFVDQDPGSGLYAIGAGLLQLGAPRPRPERAALVGHQLGGRAGGAELASPSWSAPWRGDHSSSRAPRAAARHQRPGARSPAPPTPCTRPPWARSCSRTTPAPCGVAQARELEGHTYRTVTDWVGAAAPARRRPRPGMGRRGRGGGAGPGLAGRPGARPVGARGRPRSASSGPRTRCATPGLRPRQAVATQVIGAARSVSRELGHGRRR